MKKQVLLILISIVLLSILSKCTKTKAQAKYITSTINFGNKLTTDTIKGEFIIQNIGDEDLIIEEVQPSCGCTIPTYSKMPIRKNENAKIDFVYIPKPKEIGKVRKDIVVKTNSLIRLQLLVITGNIRS